MGESVKYDKFIVTSDATFSRSPFDTHTLIFGKEGQEYRSLEPANFTGRILGGGSAYFEDGRIILWGDCVPFGQASRDDIERALLCWPEECDGWILFNTCAEDFISALKYAEAECPDRVNA